MRIYYFPFPFHHKIISDEMKKPDRNEPDAFSHLVLLCPKNKLHEKKKDERSKEYKNRFLDRAVE